MQEEPPLAENGSGSGGTAAAGRVFSPSSMLKGATSWMSTTIGRTPRASPSTKRLSVNPVALAATDAKYVTSQQLEAAKVRSKIWLGLAGLQLCCCGGGCARGAAAIAADQQRDGDPVEVW